MKVMLFCVLYGLIYVCLIIFEGYVLIVKVFFIIVRKIDGCFILYFWENDV